MDNLKVDIVDISQADLFGNSLLLLGDAIKYGNGKYAVKKKEKL